MTTVALLQAIFYLATTSRVLQLKPLHAFFQNSLKSSISLKVKAHVSYLIKSPVTFPSSAYLTPFDAALLASVISQTF